MNCYYHPNRSSMAACRACKRRLCDECCLNWGKVRLCSEECRRVLVKRNSVRGIPIVLIAVLLTWLDFFRSEDVNVLKPAFGTLCLIFLCVVTLSFVL